MGEALLIKSNAYKINTPLDDVDIMAGYCAILAIVRDSGGNLIPNIPVNCYDNGVWYNNTTNTLGMALFYTNSGNATLSTTNVCSIEGYTMVDQITPGPIVIQRENGTKVMANFNFNRYENGHKLVYRSSVGGLRFMDTHNIWAQIVGGGGGATQYTGGGGGAYNEINVQIVRSTHYSITIGNRGYSAGGWTSNGGTGGTTSAFGISAIGGQGGTGGYWSITTAVSAGIKGGIGAGSGSRKGGNGGAPYQNGYPSAYANENFNYGGGGAGCGRAVNNSEGWTINIRLNGTWYNRIPVYEDSSLRSPIRNVTVTERYSGANGGGRSADKVGTQSHTGWYIWLQCPTNGVTVALNNDLGLSFSSPGKVFGGNGTNGGGGGAGSNYARHFNGGYGGNGICVVTILD